MNNDYADQVTFSDFIIAMLLSCSSTKIMYRIMRERVKKRNQFQNSNFSQEIKRLQRRGLVQVSGNEIIFSPDALKRHRNKKISFIAEEPKKERKIIMIFDIPETNRRTRDWLRTQIKLWGFKMIQKSVWLGTGPLPAQFNKQIKYLGIEEHIKIFNVQNVKK